MEFHVSTNFIGDWTRERLTELGMRNFHSWGNCLFDDACIIHKPSQHHMIFWPVSIDYWRDMSLITRYCPHGLQHPDPDSYRFWESQGKPHLIDEFSNEEMLNHDIFCDGCCKSHSVRYITVSD